MQTTGTPDELERLLAEQVAYYSAAATEYEDHSLPATGSEELTDALEAFRPIGSVLELACGPGVWTRQLLRHASDVTAVDASAQMLAVASARIGGGSPRPDDESAGPGSGRVRFVQADLFSWTPDRRYDVVFFGFWLSHVPLERFVSFWSLVADCLKPGGRVFFVDDGHRTPAELIEGASSPVIQRRLNDGSTHRAVKVAHRPGELEQRLTRMGWNIRVTATSGPFFWGAGQSRT